MKIQYFEKFIVTFGSELVGEDIATLVGNSTKLNLVKLSIDNDNNIVAIFENEKPYERSL